jgi:hypothetical protein
MYYVINTVTDKFVEPGLADPGLPDMTVLSITGPQLIQALNIQSGLIDPICFREIEDIRVLSQTPGKDTRT